MPWGAFPLPGIALGIVGALIQSFLFRRLARALAGPSKPWHMPLIVLGKMAVYALTLWPALAVSAVDGVVCAVISAAGIILTGTIISRGARRKG